MPSKQADYHQRLIGYRNYLAPKSGELRDTISPGLPAKFLVPTLAEPPSPPKLAQVCLSRNSLIDIYYYYVRWRFAVLSQIGNNLNYLLLSETSTLKVSDKFSSQPGAAK